MVPCLLLNKRSIASPVRTSGPFFLFKDHYGGFLFYPIENVRILLRKSSVMSIFRIIGIGLFSLLGFACGGRKDHSDTQVNIFQDRLEINGKSFTVDWKLDEVLGAVSGKPRQVDLRGSSYFVFDQLGIVVYEKAGIFHPTPRGYCDAINIFFRGTADNQELPAQGFSGTAKLDGIPLNGAVKRDQLKQWSSWKQSASTGNTIRVESAQLKVYFSFRSGEEGGLDYISISPQ